MPYARSCTQAFFDFKVNGMAVGAECESATASRMGLRPIALRRTSVRTTIGRVSLVVTGSQSKNQSRGSVRHRHIRCLFSLAYNGHCYAPRLVAYSCS